MKIWRLLAIFPELQPEQGFFLRVQRPWDFTLNTFASEIQSWVFRFSGTGLLYRPNNSSVSSVAIASHP